ncbi:hypothetical protein UPYG_G00255700 [Umbra pygmaea]|uniref:Uncharacterized protein n=1 Tax=Umbra pygmaea TaxID=75934 RepID=A0ABD0W9W2_UMBPY
MQKAFIPTVYNSEAGITWWAIQKPNVATTFTTYWRNWDQTSDHKISSLFYYIDVGPASSLSDGPDH